MTTKTGEKSYNRSLPEKEEKRWHSNLEKKVKLRTYKRIKRKLCFAPYLTFKSRQCRRFLTQLRSGSNFLRIEKSRYEGEALEERIFMYCNKVEDEEHFLLDCELYKEIRQITFKSLKII